MATWPDIQEPSGISRRIIKEQIKNSFAGGYVSSIPKYSRKRYRFQLSWSSLTHIDLETLETFFDDNQGNTFTWTDPIDNASYTVRFSDDEIEADYVEGTTTYWQLTVNLEEQ